MAAFLLPALGTWSASAQDPNVQRGLLPNITIPNGIVGNVALPAVGIANGRPFISLPNLPLPNIALVDIAGLPIDLSLGGGDTLLLLNLPGISIALPNLGGVAQVGTGVLGVIVDQISGVNQSLAGITGGVVVGPVQQLIDGITTGSVGPSDGSPAMAGSMGLAPLPLVNVWMWNSVTVGASDHNGFAFRAGDAGGSVSGSTLAMRSSDWAATPGLLMDASGLAGLRPGSLYLGLSGGFAQSRIVTKGTGILQDLGIGDAGKANLDAWSAGTFALLTMKSWYTGAAVGGSWGQAETENYVTGAESAFDGTSFSSALFLGRVFPLSDAVRLDVRGTLGYQNTTGDAHLDTLGIAYGDQTVESTNGTLSARIFGAFRYGGTVLRPYVQAGVTRRFYYENELNIQGVTFDFEDADTSVFTAAGLDFDINDTWQLSIGARQEHSEDFDSIVGRFGLIVKLN